MLAYIYVVDSNIDCQIAEFNLLPNLLIIREHVLNIMTFYLDVVSTVGVLILDVLSQIFVEPLTNIVCIINMGLYSVFLCCKCKQNGSIFLAPVTDKSL